MSPWPPKLATGQNFVNKAVDVVIGFYGVHEKASLSLTFKGGKVTIAFFTTLGHLRTPPKSLPAISPEAHAAGLPASESSASRPPALCPTSRYWTPSSWSSSSWTSSSWTLCLTAGPMRAGPAREGLFLVRGKPQLTQQLHRCCLQCLKFQYKILSATIVNIVFRIIRSKNP